MEMSVHDYTLAIGHQIGCGSIRCSTGSNDLVLPRTTRSARAHIVNKWVLSSSLVEGSAGFSVEQRVEALERASNEPTSFRPSPRSGQA